MTTTVQDIIDISKLPHDASDVKSDPIAEVRRIRQLLRMYIDDNIDKESQYLQSPERQVKVIKKQYWKHKQSPLVVSMNLLKKLRPKRKLDFITYSKRSKPTNNTRYTIMAAVLLVEGGEAGVPSWETARIWLQNHPFDDVRFMRIYDDGPLIWVDEKTVKTCINRYLSKIDENELMQGEKTGLRGTIALFRWSCAVCQIVLEKKITLSGGSVRIK